MQLVAQMFKYLNSNVNYAILRNYEGLPDNINSRDIDILIGKKEYNRIKNNIIEIIISEGYKITTYFKSERLHTFVCGRIEKAKTDIIQFDFFFHTSVYGITIIKAEDMLQSKQFNGEVYHVSKEYEFLDKFLYLKLLGIPYPEKYSSLQAQMTNNDKLNVIIRQTISVESLQAIDEKSGKSLMFKKLLSNLKHNFGSQNSNLFSFWFSYIRNFLFPKGFSIGFTGPDGSGKTTVLEIIQSELNQTYSGIKLFHFRPTVLPNIGEVTYNAGLKKEVDRNYDNPHRGEKTGFISSFVRLLYYSVDYIVGYWVKTHPLLYKREIVLFDRYYSDIICDSRRSRIYFNPKFIYKFGRLFIPQLDYNILLTAETNIILSRKRELDAAGIENINNKIDFLKNKKRYYKVMNESSPQEAVREVLRVVFDEQHKKNLKRMNVQNVI